MSIIYIVLLVFKIVYFPQIVRMARKLPTGDVSGLKRSTTEEQDELLDEDDLT